MPNLLEMVMRIRIKVSIIEQIKAKNNDFDIYRIASALIVSSHYLTSSCTQSISLQLHIAFTSALN